MKALLYTSQNQVTLLRVKDPRLEPGQVKIRIKYSGVCGSDIAIFRGKHPRAKAPLILGHECIGVIDSVCECKSDLKVGDRVIVYPLISCGQCKPCRTGIPHVCQTLKLIGIDTDGAMAEYICVNESSVLKIEDSLSDFAAALVEPLAVVVHALHRARFQYLDTTVIMGAGPIGLLTAIVLRKAGVGRLIISDLNAARVAKCHSLGFDAINIQNQSLIEAVDSMTNGEGADITFEASGTGPATFESTRLTRVGGTICMVGQHKSPPVCNLPEFSFKEQQLIATRVYAKEEFAQTTKYAFTIQSELEKVISHVIPLKDAQGTFDLIDNPSEVTMKVLIDCTKS